MLVWLRTALTHIDIWVFRSVHVPVSLQIRQITLVAAIQPSSGSLIHQAQQAVIEGRFKGNPGVTTIVLLNAFYKEALLLIQIVLYY